MKSKKIGRNQRIKKVQKKKINWDRTISVIAVVLTLIMFIFTVMNNAETKRLSEEALAEAKQSNNISEKAQEMTYAITLMEYNKQLIDEFCENETYGVCLEARAKGFEALEKFEQEDYGAVDDTLINFTKFAERIRACPAASKYADEHEVSMISFVYITISITSILIILILYRITTKPRKA